jgi:DNA-binding transcriptional ArsR family regulator
MVDYRSPQLDRAFGALSDPTRRAMLFQIARKEATVTELAGPHDMTVAAVSKHLMVLEEARLITKTREGRTFLCRINPQPFKDVVEILNHFESFWATKLDSLQTYFKNKQGSDRHENPGKNVRAAQRGAKENHPRKKK